MMASTIQRDETGSINADARESIHEVARMGRLFHQLFWSVAATRLAPFHSKEGFSYLLSHRQITFEEYESLLTVETESLGVQNAALTWLMARVWMAKEEGHISVDSKEIFEKTTKLRAHMGTILAMYDGRMPIGM